MSRQGGLRARETRSLERVRGPDAEGVRCLDGVSTGDLGRGVAHVAGELLERHPVIREQRRRPVTDAVAPEVGEGPTARQSSLPGGWEYTSAVSGKLAPSTKRSLLVALLQLAWVGLLAIGASGIVAGLMGSALGPDFVAGDFPGVTYTPARCADLQEYAPPGTSCNHAAAIHHQDETVSYRMGAGVLGAVVFAVWFVTRRRLAGDAGTASARLPLGFVATAGLAMFGIVGLATLASGLGLLVLGPETGAGADLSAAVVSLIVAGVFATKLHRILTGC